jgi:hypothetical protein
MSFLRNLPLPSFEALLFYGGAVGWLAAVIFYCV